MGAFRGMILIPVTKNNATINLELRTKKMKVDYSEKISQSSEELKKLLERLI